MNISHGYIFSEIILLQTLPIKGQLFFILANGLEIESVVLVACGYKPTVKTITVEHAKYFQMAHMHPLHHSQPIQCFYRYHDPIKWPESVMS